MPDPRIWPVEEVDDTFATVQGVSVEVRPANANRVECDFTNDSDSVIYLARGNAAVIGSGQRLNPNGGTYHIGIVNLWNGQINAISTFVDQEDANLCISEGLRIK